MSHFTGIPKSPFVMYLNRFALRALAIRQGSRGRAMTQERKLSLAFSNF